MRSLPTTLALAGALATILTACAADLTGPHTSAAGSVSLSFVAKGTSSTSAPAPGAGTVSNGIVSAAGADAIVITKAQLVLSKLELQRAGATCTSEAASADDSASSTDACAELEVAPMVIDLPVNGSVAGAFSVAVPAGSYSALEAKIGPAEIGRRGTAAFLAAHPELTGASVRVEGTFNGAAFTYVGDVRAALETRFDPPLVADGSGINVTVAFDVTDWFRTSAGTLVDPATANAGGTNAALVSANIAQSFSAFRDDDHDGRDDDGGERGDVSSRS